MPRIETPFVELKRMFKDAAKESGIKMSDREAHRRTQGFLLASADGESELQYSDTTGEEAVKRALISYLRKYGSLRAPLAVAA